LGPRARAACLRKLTQLAAGTAGEGLDEVFSDYVGAVLNGAALTRSALPRLHRLVPARRHNAGL